MDIPEAIVEDSLVDTSSWVPIASSLATTPGPLCIKHLVGLVASVQAYPEVAFLEEASAKECLSSASKQVASSMVVLLVLGLLLPWVASIPFVALLGY